MPRWDPDDKERTALHEAGHAIVGWSCGAIVGCIHLDTEKQGGSAHMTFAEHFSSVEEIAYWLGGYEAEQMLKPPGSKRRAMVDVGETDRILRENEAGEELRQQGRECARTRLREHESKLRVVVSHLVQYNYMDRVTFQAMMQ